MVVLEDKAYSKSYLDPNERSIANAVQLIFKDYKSEKVEVLYPIGHKNRRNEGIPELIKKYNTNIKRHYQGEKLKNILDLIQSYDQFSKMSITDFMQLVSS